MLFLINYILIKRILSNILNYFNKSEFLYFYLLDYYVNTENKLIEIY